MKSETPPDSKETPAEPPQSITLLAWVGAVLVALLFPLVFFLVGYQSEAMRLETALQASLHGSQHLPAARLKRGEAYSVSQQIMATLAWLPDEVSVRITDDNQRYLALDHGDVSPPLLTRSVPLVLPETANARLELRRSLRPLLLYALAMLLPGMLLGTVVFFTLRDLPTRVFQRALQEIATRKSTEAQLAKSLAIFSATLESTADGILVTDTLGREIVANQHFHDMWSLPRPAGHYGNNSEMLSDIANQLRDPGMFVATLKDQTRFIDVTHGTTLELRDGRQFEWNSQPQFVNDEVVGRVTSFRDISDRKRAEALLSVEKDVLEMVVCGQPLKSALEVLADHVEVLSGEMFCAILFRESSEAEELSCATGRSLPGNVSDEIIYHGHDGLNRILADLALREDVQVHGLSDEFSGVIEHVGDHPAWQDYCERVACHGIRACFAVAVQATNGQPLGLIVAHYRDESRQRPHDRELIWVATHLTSIAIERRRAEDRLQVMAHYDVLTGLPNRVLFHDRLQQAIARAERSHGPVALMFLDLDRFKTINDTLGHDSGDVLLREVSIRLQACMREVDTVARLGGDEFTVILEQIGRAEDAATVASKIIEALIPPILLGDQETYVTASIGITIYPVDGHSVERLLKNADMAMYRTKEEGGNGYRFFTAAMNTLASDRLEIESGLRRAMDREEFIVYYQPKVDLASGEIVGAEALLRWQHPTRGLVPPGEFISILEETGLIEPVGLWVLKTVCRQIRAWQALPGFPALTVAVNLSGRQLQRDSLPGAIAAILEETGVDPQFLELEVTESMLMHDPQCAVDLLAQIRNKGILHIDVDDFGTGYSSLSYLKQFPIDCLKLDKSFVDGLPNDEDDIAISRAVIAMAHSLKLTVIAEGVETEEQLAFLRENGCDVIQGYIVSPPVPRNVFEDLVLNGQTPA